MRHERDFDDGFVHVAKRKCFGIGFFGTWGRNARGHKVGGVVGHGLGPFVEDYLVVKAETINHGDNGAVELFSHARLELKVVRPFNSH